MTVERPKVLLPLVNVAMIDYTLEWLVMNGVAEVRNYTLEWLVVNGVAEVRNAPVTLERGVRLVRWPRWNWERAIVASG